MRTRSTKLVPLYYNNRYTTTKDDAIQLNTHVRLSHSSLPIPSMVLNSSTLSNATKPPQEPEVDDDDIALKQMMDDEDIALKQMMDASSPVNNLASLRWNSSAQRLPRRPAKSPETSKTVGSSAGKKAGKAVSVDVADDNEEVSSTMMNLRPRKAGRLTRSERSRQRTSVDTKMAAETKERMRFSLSLSKAEIDEDFSLMTGAKPARRPTRRNKQVQKDVDNLYPGSWVEAPLPDMYKTF